MCDKAEKRRGLIKTLGTAGLEAGPLTRNLQEYSDNLFYYDDASATGETTSILSISRGPSGMKEYRIGYSDYASSTGETISSSSKGRTGKMDKGRTGKKEYRISYSDYASSTGETISSSGKGRTGKMEYRISNSDYASSTGETISSSSKGRTGKMEYRISQGMLQVREIREVREKSGKKTGLEIREKSGNPVSSQGKVREFRRWSGKNIKSLYTNKLTAAAPSPSLQMTRRIFYFCVVKDHLSQSFCTY
ncbi:hypothetical protein J6590_035929 [Homalodisca vitripennis]|nr:hypothetical protein J6590_035929 [Homalodisca vitripennis]